MSETLEAKFLTPGTLSGSSDALRQQIGGIWISASVNDQGQPLGPAEAGFAFHPSSNEPRDIQLIAGSTANCLYKSWASLGENSLKITPSWTVPVRITGSQERVRSEIEWKTFLRGGQAGNETYRGVFQEEAVYNINNFDYKLPYGGQRVKELIQANNNVASIWDPILINYKYNNYLPNYNRAIANLSETSIPNLYFLYMASENIINGTSVGSFEKDVVTRNSAVPLAEIEQLFEAYPTDLLPPKVSQLEYDISTATYSGLYIDSNHNLRLYLDKFVPLHPLDADTTTELNQVMSNMIFDKKATADLLGPFSKVTPGMDPITSPGYANQMPYCVEVQFKDYEPGNTTFRDIVTENSFDKKLLKLIKERFLSEETELFPAPFVSDLSFDSGSMSDVKGDSSLVLPATDYITLLASSYNNTSGSSSPPPYVYGAPADDSMHSIIHSAYEGFRFYNSMNSLNVLNRTVNEMMEPNTTFRSIGDWNNMHNECTLPSPHAFGNFLNEGENSSYNETLAFRIEKNIVADSGNSTAQRTIQNFWIYNNEDLDKFQFMDTQVKYGTTYSYNIYAYVLAAGVKYEYSDLRIATINSEVINTDPAAPPQYCLYFINEEGERDSPLCDGGDGSEDVLISLEPYVADFNITYEPTLKIYEVPVSTKQLSILDHPPNVLDVVAFQTVDNSQKLGFFLDYESFDKALMPIALTEQDAQYVSRYMSSNDILAGEAVTMPATSPQANIEVFRTTTKPTKYRDFEGHLLTTISLAIENNNNYLSNNIFYDKINTNETYYYLFRVISAAGTIGRISPIIEATLVDDGGYKYSIFNELYSQDLDEDNFILPTTPFKKLLQVVPNLQHLALDTSNVDYNTAAFDQLDNLEVGSTDPLDTIWDRTFKLRLTSKKTGKKIDINLTYKISNE